MIHVGGRVATAEARLTDASGNLYGHATTTCMVFRPGRPEKTGCRRVRRLGLERHYSQRRRDTAMSSGW